MAFEPIITNLIRPVGTKEEIPLAAVIQLGSVISARCALVDDPLDALRKLGFVVGEIHSKAIGFCVLGAKQAADAVPIFPLATHQVDAASGVPGANTRRPRLWFVILNKALVFAVFDLFDRLCP